MTWTREDFVGDGETGIVWSDFARAVSVWSIMQDRTAVTVAEVATAFNADPRCVIEAVEENPWALLVGPPDDFSKLAIEFDGE